MEYGWQGGATLIVPRFALRGGEPDARGGDPAGRPAPPRPARPIAQTRPSPPAERRRRAHRWEQRDDERGAQPPVDVPRGSCGRRGVKVCRSVSHLAPAQWPHRIESCGRAWRAHLPACSLLYASCAALRLRMHTVPNRYACLPVFRSIRIDARAGP
jgi:hypothetical protein